MCAGKSGEIRQKCLLLAVSCCKFHREPWRTPAAASGLLRFQPGGFFHVKNKGRSRIWSPATRHRRLWFAEVKNNPGTPGFPSALVVLKEPAGVTLTELCVPVATALSQLSSFPVLGSLLTSEFTWSRGTEASVMWE